MARQRRRHSDRIVAVENSTTYPGVKTGPPQTGDKARKTGGVDVPAGWLLLAPVGHPELTLLVEQGDNAPMPVSGYGGTDVVARPQRLGLTVFTGYEPFVVEADVVLDGDGRSVEPARQVLEALAGVGPRRLGGTGHLPPPLLDVIGDPTFDLASSWVLADIRWDRDETIKSDDDPTAASFLVASLTFRQDAGQVRRLADQALEDAKQNARAKTGQTTTYVVQQDDDLMKIARKKLGDASRWRELAKLNGIRDPRSLKPGAKIKLPR